MFGRAGFSSVGFLTGNLLCLRGVSPSPRAHDLCYLLGMDETPSCYNLDPWLSQVPESNSIEVNDSLINSTDFEAGSSYGIDPIHKCQV